MEIKLYNYTGNSNTINKTLPQARSVVGHMSNELDIDNPTIKMTTYTTNYNYIYIPLLHRYYFIDNITIDPNGVFILKLSIDVLMTFKDEIMNATVHVIEGESDSFDISQATTSEPLKVFDTINLTNPFNYDNKTTVLIALNTGTEG